MNNRGFTLIELLVVIAIIGLLASIVLTSLSGARAKGRDAKRIAELKEFVNLVELSGNAGVATAFGGCTGTSGNRLSSCTSPASQNFKDPSGSTSVCPSGATLSSTCDYTVTAASAYATAPKFNDWQIKIYLEVGSGLLPQGIACITSNSYAPTNSGCK